MFRILNFSAETWPKHYSPLSRQFKGKNKNTSEEEGRGKCIIKLQDEISKKNYHFLNSKKWIMFVPGESLAERAE